MNTNKNILTELNLFISKLILILFLTVNTLYSQSMEVRIPYLKGDKYGVCDDNMQILIEAIYDDVIIFDKFKIIALSKNKHWGIYNYNGQKLIDHKIKDIRKYHRITPFVSTPYPNKNTKALTYNLPSLVKIKDIEKKVEYYVNPNKIINHYRAYKLNGKRNYDAIYYRNFPITSYVRVVNLDNSINFIDSTGFEVFKQNVKDGYVVNNRFLAIYNGEKYALYRGNKKITAFKYNKFKILQEVGLVYGILDEKQTNGRFKEKYHLFDNEGKLRHESYEWFRTSENLIVSGYKNRVTVFDNKLNKLLEFPGKRPELFIRDQNIFIKSSHNYLYGLRDINGNILLDTVYQAIDIAMNYIHTLYQGNHKIMDFNFNKIIESDSVISLRMIYPTNLFIFSIFDNYKEKYGIMDINHKIVIKPNWSDIHNPCQKIIIFKSDSTQVVRNIVDGIDLFSGKRYPSCDVNCKNNTIAYTSDSSHLTTIIDFKGNVKYKEKKRINNYYYSDTSLYEIKRISNKYYLTNKSGVKVIDRGYENIEKIKDLKTKKSVYFCTYATRTHPSCDIYNDQLEQIAPKGYSIPERWVYLMGKNKGTILVANDADIAINKYNFRLGLIDYEGNWIIKPFFGLFKFIGKGIFIFKDYKKGGLIIFNEKGEKVSSKKYSYIQKWENVHPNRLLVGILTDSSSLIKAEKLVNETKDFWLLAEKLDSLGEPKFNYGYINYKGKEVIPIQYTQAEPFNEFENITFVNKKDGQGNNSSCVIDTSGNEILCTPFDNLKFLSKFHYNGVKNNLYAVVDTFGKNKTPFMFKTIYDSYNIPNYFVGKDSTNYFLISKTNYYIFPLGKADNIQFKNVDDKYIWVILKNKYKYQYKKKHYIYRKDDLKLVGTFENLLRISTKFNNEELPNGYLKITELENSPSYIYRINDKKCFKE